MKELVAHPLTLAAFGGILSEEIEWKPFPAFPPSARLAVVVGEPSENGFYTVRVRVPQGVKLMPHRHREDRVYSEVDVRPEHLREDWAAMRAGGKGGRPCRCLNAHVPNLRTNQTFTA